MANKTFKNALTKAGTTAAFAVAMTAALTIQASADETVDAPVETPVETPVVEAPAVVETSTDVQEVTQHNDAVESSNDQIVQDNNNAASGNDSIDSGNDSTASGNDSIVSGNEGAASGNEDTASGNEGTASGNEGTVSGNEGTASGNDGTVSGNEGTASGNDSIVSGNDHTTGGNESTDSTNQDIVKDNESKIEGNEDLTNELPEAPKAPEAPEVLETPDLSDAPNVPETPNLPDLSDAPEAPETPNLPDMPDTPDALETPDLDTENTDDYNNSVGDYNDAVGDYNDAAGDYNEAVGNYNGAAGDYNEAVGNYNDAAGDYNEAVDNYNGAADDYNNAVGDYNGAADDYNNAVGEANGKIDDYNNAVGDYNEAVDEYNGKVDDYNAAVDEINKELKEQFDKEHAEWKTDKETYDTAWAAYQAYLNAQKEYQEKHAQWEIDHGIWEQKLTAHREAYGYTNEEEYNALVAAYEKAYGEWEDECERLTNDYNAKKAKYDQLVTENQIYDDVLDYNGDVIFDNGEINKSNADLEEADDAATVDTLAEAATSNAEVNAKLEKTEEGKALLDTLNGTFYQKLVEEEKRLAGEAAALEAEAAKGYKLGTADYETYLARVKQFNDDVKTHNGNVAIYNEAITKYNTEVSDYIANEEPETGKVGGYEQGTADWGNVDIDGHTPGHLDVKYAAAVTVKEENGTHTIVSDKYTVDGVYTDSTKTGDDYGLNYLNKNTGEFATQGLNKQSYEFRIDEGDGGKGHGKGGNQNKIAIDPATGKVTFTMTAEDTEGNPLQLTVNLDASSTYAEGTYFAPADGDKLQYFEDADGKLETITINGKKYYNISGKSVFVISSVACNGAGVRGNEEDGYTISPDGLDLVLNMETLIKIHKENTAQKITYKNLLLGKTAYAEAPEKPGNEPELKLPNPPKGPGDFTPFTDLEPQEPKLNPVDPPKDFTDPEPKLVQLQKLTHIEKLNPIENKLNPIENQLNPVEKLDTIENKLNPVEKLDTIDTLDKLDYKMVLVIPEETPEEEPVWFFDDVPVEEPEVVFLAEEGNLVNILDEMVPLADAPLTGDASSLFGLASLFSLGGLLMLNKKKRT